jgi:hypothetical protein
MPGTFSFLGVRTPGTDITTSYFHFGGFNPDERAIGLGVRAMAGWLAERGLQQSVPMAVSPSPWRPGTAVG